MKSKVEILDKEKKYQWKQYSVNEDVSYIYDKSTAGYDNKYS